MDEHKRPFEPPMLREEMSLVEGTLTGPMMAAVLFSGSAT